MVERLSVRTLFTLAYPGLSADDQTRLEAFRRDHDPNCSVVRAHFTMVFGCNAVAEGAYLDHVRQVCRQGRPIQFTCRFAMLGADDEAERAYVFLVPDEGFSGIARLHAALYRGVLRERLRLDLPYIPHITLGASPDRASAKQWCDDLNESGLEIHGAINTLAVSTREHDTMRTISEFNLGA